MHKINITGSVYPVSRWIKDNSHAWATPGGDPVWICENCGGGRHVWGIESTSPQLAQCPDCKSIMVNN